MIKRGGQCKIGREEVVRMRERYIAGATQGELARDYKLSVTHVARIVRGESWQDVGMPTLTPSQLDDVLKRVINNERAAKGENPLPTGPHGLPVPPTAQEIKAQAADAALKELEGMGRGAVEKMTRYIGDRNADKLLDELTGKKDE